MTTTPGDWKKVQDREGELEDIKDSMEDGQQQVVLGYRKEDTSMEKMQVVLEKDALEGYLYYWRYDTGEAGAQLKYQYDHDEVGEWSTNYQDAKDEALYKINEITEPSKEELSKKLNIIISQSGGLIQEHPNVGSWETTRPGAMNGEIVAFKNDEANFKRLSIRYYEEGMVRPGLGISKEEASEDQILETDYWIVETMDRDEEYAWGENEWFKRQSAAADRVAEIMLEVTENRE